MSTGFDPTNNTNESSTTYSLIFGIAAYALAMLLILVLLAGGGWAEQVSGVFDRTGSEQGSVLSALSIAFQIMVALGIYNVWILRPSRPTPYRGGGTRTMREEFAFYGLPEWSVLAVGALKLVLATVLLIGIWLPAVVAPAAAGMAVLMLGAVVMHVKVGDPFIRMLPALTMLVLSAAILAV